MTTGIPPVDELSLAGWRRRVAEAYAAVRVSPPGRPAWASFVTARQDLFRTHPQSPLVSGGLRYHPYSASARVMGRIDTTIERHERRVQLGSDGELRLLLIGVVRFTYGGREAGLELYWVAGYGGGVFLPFGDASNGDTTYGGGRYLYDGIKGADLGVGETEIVLDFNYAYNPSCAYEPTWICPLPSPENRLGFPVEAGELWPPDESVA